MRSPPPRIWRRRASPFAAPMRSWAPPSASAWRRSASCSNSLSPSCNRWRLNLRKTSSLPCSSMQFSTFTTFLEARPVVTSRPHSSQRRSAYLRGKDTSMLVRKAILPDVPQIHKLIAAYSPDGTLLPRSFPELCENVRDFIVVEDRNRIIGCGALHLYGHHLTEIRSIAVLPRAKGKG